MKGFLDLSVKLFGRAAPTQPICHQARSCLLWGLGMNLRATPSWDFPDYKGWDMFIGEHAEGQIIYRDKDSLDADACDAFPAGFSWHGYVPNEDQDGGPFDSFEEAKADMEKRLLEAVSA